MKTYLKEIQSYEYKKRKMMKKWMALTWAIILIASIYIGLSGRLETVMEMKSLNKETLKYYKTYYWSMHGPVDDTYREIRQQEYEKLVDTYRLSDEEILTNHKAAVERGVEGWSTDDTLEDILYDIEYSSLIFPFEQWSELQANGRDIIIENDYGALNEETILAWNQINYLTYDAHWMLEYEANPVDNVLGLGGYKYYSSSLQKDFAKLAEAKWTDKTIMAGNYAGWDIRVCMMQVLPFTLGILILVSFCGLFSQEREHEVQSILITAKYGQHHVTSTKLRLALRTASLYWITFQATIFLVISAVLGVEGWDCTYLPILTPCPYALTGLQIYMLQLILSYCGTLFFTLFVCMLSSLLSGKVTLLIGLGLIVATGSPIMRYNLDGGAYMFGHKIKALMPTQLMSGFGVYQSYQGYAIGDFVIRLPWAVYLTIIVGSVFCLWVIYKRGKTS